MANGETRDNNPVILIQDFDGVNLRFYELEYESAQTQVRQLLSKLVAEATKAQVAA